jgi:hypothetical protein
MSALPPFDTEEIQANGTLGDIQRRMAAHPPTRALGPSAHVKPDRERICHGASSNRADQGSLVGEDRQAHGVQTRQRRCENMAAIKWRKPVAESRSRHQIKMESRSSKCPLTRRLIDLLTNLPHSSYVKPANRLRLRVAMFDHPAL